MIGTPATYSITKYSVPWGVEPASNTVAMAGWSINANACRSDSNRAITPRVFMPVLTSFRATRRRTGFPLLSQPDFAHAAFADLLQQAIAADHQFRGFRRQH